MKFHSSPVRLLPVVLFLLSLCLSLPARSAEGDEASVRKAVNGFYSALNVMFTGDVEPMLAVWSHAKDATYLGPGGGILVGWKSISAEWKKQAGQKLGGKVKPTDVHIVVGDALAVVVNREVGKNLNADGKAEDVSIRATNVFRKEDGQWKMIGHHTDRLSYIH